MIEEIEKWDHEGNIHKNMGGVYEGHEIEWTDPDHKPNMSGDKAYKKLCNMFDLHTTEAIHTPNYTLNGYNKDDIGR